MVVHATARSHPDVESVVIGKHPDFMSAQRGSAGKRPAMRRGRANVAVEVVRGEDAGAHSLNLSCANSA